MKNYTCAICHKAVDVVGAGLPTLYPFCSERCKFADLFKWMHGDYIIDSVPVDPNDIVDEDSDT